eukprot:6461048-Prorocentrum_lima.AAC.1
MASCFGCLRQQRFFDNFFGAGAAWRSASSSGPCASSALIALCGWQQVLLPVASLTVSLRRVALRRLDVAERRLLVVARRRLAMAPALPMVWRSDVVHETGAVGSKLAVSKGILPSKLANAPFVR